MKRWEAFGLILVLLILVGLPVAVFSYQFLRESRSPEASLRISTLEGDPAAGGEIFRRRCVACHGKQGEGAFGPDLRGAGLLGAAYLYQIILNPHNGIALAGHPPRMPELAFSKEEAIDVVTYLLSIKDPLVVQRRAEEALAKLATTSVQEVQAKKAIDIGQARALYFAKGCAACHGEDAGGTAGAPPLIRVPREEIRRKVREPQGAMAMLSFGPKLLSDEELEAIIFYIESLGKGEEQGRETTDLEQARALYISKGCAACHGADARGAGVGPPLLGVPREEIRRKVREPQGAMPAYSPERLSDEDLEQIIRYLESLGKGGGGQ